MPIKLTAADWRAIFPRAPQQVVDAFAAKQAVLDKAGITATRTRLAYFLANVEHECGGFTIPTLTENINYTAARMAQVWPSRFKSAAAVVAKYGAARGWQAKAIDDIYGNRMGNRPGTSDGSRYIGRGGPQWTGRDGYAALERITGLPAVMNPEIASRLDLQPEICAAFWQWKGLNRYADAGDFAGCVKAWNGGSNGMADRKAQMAGNDPIVRRLQVVSDQAAAIPDVKAAPVTKREAVAGGAAGVVSTAVTAGVQQGWGWEVWAVAGLLLAAGVAAGALGWWWWRKRRAASEALPAASLGLSGTMTMTQASAAAPPMPAVAKPRRKRKSAAKPAAKRKSTNRKAA
ncbi:glycoside hydrolase family 19 protein [Rhodopseudomonas telluris]|uniref:Glycoside hydrolase family 19 protein n=1 Tax=Rhodopseudomonas telluris TaxID=644215 RepID=A0ABV6F0S1_9BRAD